EDVIFIINKKYLKVRDATINNFIGCSSQN
ncbi:MAG: hypothetical protein ACJA0H_001729, partial [Francisellaceae bacterium]